MATSPMTPTAHIWAASGKPYPEGIHHIAPDLVSAMRLLKDKAGPPDSMTSTRHPLFQRIRHILKDLSGISLLWKIECDDLTGIASARSRFSSFRLRVMHAQTWHAESVPLRREVVPDESIDQELTSGFLDLLPWIEKYQELEMDDLRKRTLTSVSSPRAAEREARGILTEWEKMKRVWEELEPLILAMSPVASTETAASTGGGESSAGSRPAAAASYSGGAAAARSFVDRITDQISEVNDHLTAHQLPRQIDDMFEMLRALDAASPDQYLVVLRKILNTSLLIYKKVDRVLVCFKDASKESEIRKVCDRIMVRRREYEAAFDPHLHNFATICQTHVERVFAVFYGRWSNPAARAEWDRLIREIPALLSNITFALDYSNVECFEESEALADRLCAIKDKLAAFHALDQIDKVQKQLAELEGMPQETFFLKFQMAIRLVLLANAEGCKLSRNLSKRAENPECIAMKSLLDRASSELLDAFSRQVESSIDRFASCMDAIIPAEGEALMDPTFLAQWNREKAALLPMKAVLLRVREYLSSNPSPKHIELRKRIDDLVEVYGHIIEPFPVFFEVAMKADSSEQEGLDVLKKRIGRFNGICKAYLKEPPESLKKQLVNKSLKTLRSFVKLKLFSVSEGLKKEVRDLQGHGSLEGEWALNAMSVLERLYSVFHHPFYEILHKEDKSEIGSSVHPIGFPLYRELSTIYYDSLRTLTPAQLTLAVSVISSYVKRLQQQTGDKRSVSLVNVDSMIAASEREDVIFATALRQYKEILSYFFAQREGDIASVRILLSTMFADRTEESVAAGHARLSELIRMTQSHMLNVGASLETSGEYVRHVTSIKFILRMQKLLDVRSGLRALEISDPHFREIYTSLCSSFMEIMAFLDFDALSDEDKVKGHEYMQPIKELLIQKLSECIAAKLKELWNIDTSDAHVGEPVFMRLFPRLGAERIAILGEGDFDRKLDRLRIALASLSSILNLCSPFYRNKLFSSLFPFAFGADLNESVMQFHGLALWTLTAEAVRIERLPNEEQEVALREWKRKASAFYAQSVTPYFSDERLDAAVKGRLAVDWNVLRMRYVPMRYGPPSGAAGVIAESEVVTDGFFDSEEVISTPLI